MGVSKIFHCFVARCMWTSELSELDLHAVLMVIGRRLDGETVAVDPNAAVTQRRACGCSLGGMPCHGFWRPGAYEHSHIKGKHCVDHDVQCERR